MKTKHFCIAVGLLALTVFTACAAEAQDGRFRQWLESRRTAGNGQGGAAGFDMDKLETWGNTSCLDKAAKLKKRKWLLDLLGKDRPQPSLTAAYGTHEAQAIDVYLPPNGTPAPRPVIFMVHGGGWCIGDKGMTKVTKNKVARWVSKGFILVSVNYRMIPDNADVATQAQDVAAALAYVQKNAAKWQADPAKVIIMGHSAGAHLVALLGADTKGAAAMGVRPWLGTISLDSGTLDVQDTMHNKHYGLYNDAFGQNPDFWKAVSPLPHLSSASLPFLGVCSSRRQDACPQAHAYVKKSTALGVKAAVLEQNLGHGAINDKLGEPGDYTAAVEAFMASLDKEVARRLR